MVHLGDVTKIDGHKVPIVDCLIGGSPCQDLSVAGKRKGMLHADKGDDETTRSGLFMEQIRLIKEMRDSDRQRADRRADEPIRPRYMVWENVPGAFSSNKGEDFRVVLEEVARISEAGITIPGPEKGKWSNSGCIIGDGYSIAWRVFDAQYWGVPQRRKRICLVADFDGHTAAEIVFNEIEHFGCTDSGDTKPSVGDSGDECRSEVQPESESMPGDSEQSRETREEASTDASGSFGASNMAFTMQDREGCAGGGKGFLLQPDRSASLRTNNFQTVFQPIITYALDQQGGKGMVGFSEDVCPTICADSHGPHAVTYALEGNGQRPSQVHGVCYKCDGAEGGGTSFAIVGDHQNRPTDMTNVIVSMDRETFNSGDGFARVPGIRDDGIQPTLVARGPGAVCYPDACSWDGSQTVGTLTANNAGGNQRMPDKDNFNCVIQRYIVRRLTPLECERLQGYPSFKKVDLSKMTKDEYIAYAIYNKDIIVDAENGKIFTTRGPGGIQLEKPRELIGSDCNGYLVSKITCNNTKLTCRHHRIVWISQYGVIPEGYVIDHINNNKKDNRISNLQLLTPQENSTKAKNDGLYPEGEDNKATKLAPELRDEIAFLYDVSDMTIRELAELYGISKSRVGQIIKEVGWTDIGDWADTNDKIHKLSDSHRYKALGNSIALPSWKWVLKRMCGYYERPATLASLFDGIGGFPLIWEQINGKGTCLWASEIEEFPMAVTRKRFK